jgi:C4-type Zn-finger protein
MWPFSKIKELKAENDRLTDLLIKSETGQITIEDINLNNGLEMTLSGSPIGLFANAFYQQFEDSGATNFLALDFFHQGSNEKFEIIMQKVSGESACEQLKRLRQELDQLNRIGEKV